MKKRFINTMLSAFLLLFAAQPTAAQDIQQDNKDNVVENEADTTKTLPGEEEFLQAKTQIYQEDYEEARKLLEKSAEAGYPDAIAELGLFYEKGITVDEDVPHAIELYRKAAENNSVRGMVLYALSYEDGTAGETDTLKANFWYEKAAQHEEHYAAASAARNLGHNYYYGAAGVQDFEKAFKWLSKVADSYDDAAYLLGRMYRDGDYVKQNYTKAAIYFRRGARNNDADAAFALGMLYMDGLGVTEDVDRAIHWLKVAGVMGEPSGYFNIGVIYLNGMCGVEIDKEMALYYFKLAQEDGDETAGEIIADLEEELGIDEEEE